MNLETHYILVFQASLPVMAIFFTCPFTSFTSLLRSPDCLVTLIGAPFTGSALGLLLLIVVLTVSTVAAVKKKRIILEDDGQYQCHRGYQKIVTGRVWTYHKTLNLKE